MDKLDSEKNCKEKGCKTVMLSSDKLDREYGKSGGKAIALKRPKCSHSLCDKEPDYDDNAKVNKSITKDWQANKKHLEHFNMQHSGTPCPWLQRHPIIVTTAARLNAAIMSQMHQGYPNNSLDPFSLGGSATFHQNSNTNSTPGDYKTAETQEESSPDFVVSCRNILLDRSFDLCCDEAEKDVALEGGKALTKIG